MDLQMTVAGGAGQKVVENEGSSKDFRVGQRMIRGLPQTHGSSHRPRGRLVAGASVAPP